MSEPPADRCRYIWPEEYELSARPQHQSCCWRESMEGADHCVWHADPAKVSKSVEKLQAARTPCEVRDAISIRLGVFTCAETLDGVNLSGMEIGDDIDFGHVTLRDADLSGATLSDGAFSEAVLFDADLSGATLAGADFSGATLAGADLSGTDVRGAIFSGASLSNCNLSNASINPEHSTTQLKQAFLYNEDQDPIANFSDASLRDATLSNAELWGVNFSNAQIIGADVSGADLEGANLSGAYTTTDITGADPEITDLSDANLSRANLSDADLRNAAFSNTELDEASLRNANIRGTDLSELSFVRADLSKANLCNTNLTDANLKDANLSGTALEHAVLIRTNLFDADLTEARPHGATLTDVQINDDTEIRSDEQTQAEAQWWQKGPLSPFQRCGYDPEQNRDSWMEYIPGCRLVYRTLIANSEDDTNQLGKAADTYQTFEKLARENARPSLQSEMFVLRQDMQRKRHWHNKRYSQWAFSRMSRVVFKHGESLGRIAVSAILIILVYAAVYAQFDLIIQGEGEFIENTVDAVYFSTLTFTTLGLGDFQPLPASELARGLVTTQAALGAILIAIFVFVLGRRAAK